MADALCGPSNALQSFKQHSQVDRTLQQDRLGGPRHSPAQDFRTQHPHAAAQADAEFAAFQAQQPNPFQFELPQQSHYAPSYPPAQMPQGTTPSWAADFQSLRIQERPLQSQHFHTEAPLMRSNGWQNEFVARHPNGKSLVAQGKQALQPNVFDQAYHPMQQTSSSMYSGTYGTPQQPLASYGLAQQMPEQVKQEPVYDEAAFEAAFAEANNHAKEMAEAVRRRDMDNMVDETIAQAQREHAQEHGSDLLHKDALIDQNILDYADTDFNLPTMEAEPEPSQFKIGSDKIKPFDRNMQITPDQAQRDADELARTAGQLLNNVEHDQSEKFKNSKFLALMRGVRDGRVRVSGDDFKEVAEIERTDLEKIHDRLTKTRPDTPIHRRPEVIARRSRPWSTYHPRPLETHVNDTASNIYEDLAETEARFHAQADEVSAQATEVRTSRSSDLHPGGPFYPEQSPPRERASISSWQDSATYVQDSA